MIVTQTDRGRKVASWQSCQLVDSKPSSAKSSQDKSAVAHK